jgi:hypothetical protein
MGRKTLALISFSIINLSALILVSASAGAVSPTISRAYKAGEPIMDDSLVSLSQKNGDVIDETNNTNSSRLLGIAIANNNSLLAIDSSNSTVQVAISGTVNALVSSVNGSIEVGDQVSVSPFNGIGIKALPGSKIIGLAETTFTSSSRGVTKLMVKDKQGKYQTISVGFVKIEISIGNGSYASGSGGAQINSLQKLIKGFTGKTVPTSRIVTSLGIAFVSILSLVTLIYSSIYGSIVSIGRNPLAKHVVIRALIIIIGLVGVVAVVAGGAIYLLLH